METAAMKNFQSIVCTILFLLLISPLSADPTKVVDLKFPPKIEAGQQYSASVVLDAPAPAGGSKVILLPTHRIEYQDTLIPKERRKRNSHSMSSRTRSATGTLKKALP